MKNRKRRNDRKRYSQARMVKREPHDALDAVQREFERVLHLFDGKLPNLMRVTDV